MGNWAMHDSSTAGSHGDGRETPTLLHEVRKKKVWLAYALWAILGIGGAHRFYIGGRSTRYGWVLWSLSLFLQALLFLPTMGWLESPTLVGFVSLPPTLRGPLGLWAISLGPWALDGALTYFAVCNRNRELLAAAHAQQTLLVHIAPTGHSTPMQLAAVVLNIFLVASPGLSVWQGDGEPAADQTPISEAVP